MKHLLRKLHIGGGFNEHQRLGEALPVSSPTSNPDPSAASASSSASTSTSSSATMGGIGTVEPVGDRSAVDGGCADFNFLEEEFQVQLALAISASDPDSREDPESAQIDAVKRISLGGSAAVTDSRTLVDILSIRYWVRF